MSDPKSPASLETFIETPGPAGTKIELHLVPRKANEERDDESRIRDTSPRGFKVYARLSRGPLGAEKVIVGFGSGDGSSYFLVPESAISVRAQTSEGMFELRKNGDDELSLVEFECVATGPAEARGKFFAAVLPFLNHLSYVANCPVEVATIRVEDGKNEITHLECVIPFKRVTVNPHESRLYNDMAPVYAMYREAKASHSDFYRFLCYYKIMEGLLGSMRSQVYRLAREHNITLEASRDRVPGEDVAQYIPKAYRENVGTPIKAFFDEVLTPQFRNAVAHFMTDDGGVLNMSDPSHIARYADIQFISELCCRQVIRSHEMLLAALHSNARSG